MSDNPLIEDLDHLDELGLSAETVRSARRDLIKAHATKGARRLVTAISDLGVRIAISDDVRHLVETNRALQSDRYACRHGDYSAYKAHVKALEGQVGDLVNLKPLMRPHDPRETWRTVAWMLLFIGAGVAAMVQWILWTSGGPPDLYTVLPRAGWGAYAVIALLLIAMALPQNRREVHSRVQEADQLARDAAYLDECIRDAFPMCHTG